MKKSLLLFALLISLFKTYGQTTIGGVYSVSTTLKLVNSPFIVTNNLLVKKGITLTIEPGVVLKLDSGVYIQVDGNLRALGTSIDSIYFTLNTVKPLILETWGGIKFTDFATDFDPLTGNGCSLDYCVIEKLAYPIHSPVTIYDSKVGFNHCNIRNNKGGITSFGLGSIQLLNSKIHNCNSSVLSLQNSNWGNNWDLIKGNEIYDNLDTDPTVTIGRAVISDNYFHDNNISAGITARIKDTSVLLNNIFEDGYTALLLCGGDRHIIKCNTFNNNSINIGLTCNRNSEIRNNQFNNFKSKNIYWCLDLYDPIGRPYLAGGSASFGTCKYPTGSGAYATLDFTGNYWGGLTTSQIDSSIWDYNDDFSSKALINYSPTLSSAPDTSADCSYITLGVKETVVAQKEINFYPNPFTNSATLEFDNPQAKPHELSVFNALGQLVLHIETIKSNKLVIERKELQSGLYFYQLRNDESVVGSGKMMIE